MFEVSYDPYGSDVLATDWRKSKTPPPAEHEAVHGLVVEEMMTGWCGAVTGIEGKTVQLEDRNGKRRVFPLGPGFLLEGKPVILGLNKADDPKHDMNIADFGKLGVLPSLALDVGRGSGRDCEGDEQA